MNIMKRILNATLLVIIMFALSSCGEDRTHEYFKKTKENQWIYDTMKEVYLWRDEIKSPEYSQFFVPSKNFFSSLLHKEDIVSHFTDTVSAGDYGMTLAVMRDPISERPSKVYALVLFVEHGSPAYAAGIERGMWISSANGKSFTTSNYSQLTTGNGVDVGTERMDYDDDADKYYWTATDTVAIGAAAPYSVANIVIDSVYSIRNKKVGYMLCNSFDGEDFKDRCDEVFSEFLSEDVSEVVIDLRYNSGGSITNASYMASSLVPATLAGTPFSILKDSKGDIDTTYNYTESLFSLGEKKIYFLTGSRTKGSAELLAGSVNSSRSMYDVMTVGEATAGSSIIVEEIVSPYGFSINPATAVACMPNGEPFSESDSKPDYIVNELDNKELHQLGNDQELLLYSTLYLIVNGHIPE